MRAALMRGQGVAAWYGSRPLARCLPECGDIRLRGTVHGPPGRLCQQHTPTLRGYESDMPGTITPQTRHKLARLGGCPPELPMRASPAMRGAVR